MLEIEHAYGAGGGVHIPERIAGDIEVLTTLLTIERERIGVWIVTDVERTVGDRDNAGRVEIAVDPSSVFALGRIDTDERRHLIIVDGNVAGTARDIEAEGLILPVAAGHVDGQHRILDIERIVRIAFEQDRIPIWPADGILRSRINLDAFDRERCGIGGDSTDSNVVCCNPVRGGEPGVEAFDRQVFIVAIWNIDSAPVARRNENRVTGLCGIDRRLNARKAAAADQQIPASLRTLHDLDTAQRIDVRAPGIDRPLACSGIVTEVRNIQRFGVVYRVVLAVSGDGVGVGTAVEYDVPDRCWTCVDGLAIGLQRHRRRAGGDVGNVAVAGIVFGATDSYVGDVDVRPV